jgi:hypothetical protein
MSPNPKTRASRKLVLNRETVRTLATQRPAPFVTIQEAGVITSCGDVCTCACGDTLVAW